MAEYRIAVLIAAHNRRKSTLACLEALRLATSSRFSITTVLVDDGSTDGTADAVSQRFPEVQVIHGAGDLYWSRGMNLAWRVAFGFPVDAYLWLNDDVILYERGLHTLVDTLDCWRQLRGEDCIVAGCLQDPETGSYTYGVAKRGSRWHPGRWRMVEPNLTSFREVDSFHGNVVLVPDSVAQSIGIIDGSFGHAMGDTDYALRAQASGIAILAAPGFVGTCPRNLSTPRNVRELMNRKFVPPRDWFVLTRRHSGPLTWPLAFASPYLGFLIPRRRWRKSGWDVRRSR